MLNDDRIRTLSKEITFALIHSEGLGERSDETSQEIVSDRWLEEILSPRTRGLDPENFTDPRIYAVQISRRTDGLYSDGHMDGHINGKSWRNTILDDKPFWEQGVVQFLHCGIAICESGIDVTMKSTRNNDLVFNRYSEKMKKLLAENPLLWYAVQRLHKRHQRMEKMALDTSDFLFKQTDFCSFLLPEPSCQKEIVDFLSEYPRNHDETGKKRPQNLSLKSVLFCIVQLSK